MYCYIAKYTGSSLCNIQSHHFVTYSPQQALEVHHVIILLLSFGNERLRSDYRHVTFQNFMEIHRKCTREMSEVISDAFRRNASKQNKYNSTHTHTHTHTHNIYPNLKTYKISKE